MTNGFVIGDQVISNPRMTSYKAGLQKKGGRDRERASVCVCVCVRQRDRERERERETKEKEKKKSRHTVRECERRECRERITHKQMRKRVGYKNAPLLILIKTP